VAGRQAYSYEGGREKTKKKTRGLLESVAYQTNVRRTPLEYNAGFSFCIQKEGRVGVSWERGEGHIG